LLATSPLPLETEVCEVEIRSDNIFVVKLLSVDKPDMNTENSSVAATSVNIKLTST